MAQQDRWPNTPILAGLLLRGSARIAALQGWRRALVAGLAGGGAALAMPPIGFVPILFVAFPVLLWLIDGARGGRGAFAAGWLFGFGYFLIGLYWIANALLVDAAQFAWLIPFAVCGLPALLGLFTGLAAWAQRRWGGSGTGRVLMLGVFWCGFEWIRGHAFTGFPWNLIGYAWSGSDAMLQLAAVVGIYGLGFLTLLAAAAPAALVPQPDPEKFPSLKPNRRLSLDLRLPSVMALLLAAVWVGGVLRLAGPEEGTVPEVRLRIVQANIPQQLKWDEAQRVAHVRRHLELSRLPPAPGEPAPTLIIWPETAVPFFLNAEPRVIEAIAGAAPVGGAIVTGAPRLERDGDGSPRIWNSIMAIDASGALVATYDKVHLVPFGEYVPFREVLSLSKITAGTTDFTPGEGLRTVDIAGAPPVSPLVCYEVIFPGAVVAPDGPAPRWLLNVTNDGWYGRSAGPYQHLQIARMRAIEQGLPLVRAANTGISAVFDARGTIIARLGLDRAGTLDAGLPQARPSPTPYSRFGDAGFAFMLLAGAAGVGGLRRTRLKRLGLPTYP